MSAGSWRLYQLHRGQQIAEASAAKARNMASRNSSKSNTSAWAASSA